MMRIGVVTKYIQCKGIVGIPIQWPKNLKVELPHWVNFFYNFTKIKKPETVILYAYICIPTYYLRKRQNKTQNLIEIYFFQIPHYELTYQRSSHLKQLPLRSATRVFNVEEIYSFKITPFPWISDVEFLTV